MSGRIGITFKDVANAATKLRGKGQNPTVDRVREILQTGSKTTIAKFLKQWKESHNLISPQEGAIPEDLLALIRGLWEKLQEDANERVKTIRHEANNAITLLRKEIEDYKKNNTTTKNELQDTQKSLEQREQQIDELGQKLSQSSQENIISNERNESLKKQFNEQQQETEKLHSLLKHMQDNLEHYQNTMQKLREEQIIEIDKQKTAYEQEINKLRQDYTTLLHIKTQLEITNSKTNNELQQAQEKYSLLETQFIETKEQLKVTVNKLTETNDSLQKTQQKSQQLNTDLELKKCSIAQQTQEIQKLNAQKTSLEEKILQTRSQVSSLEHERKFLLQDKKRLEQSLQKLQMK